MGIAVLLSGGVDSSVALALLKSRDLDLTAFYLKVWLEDEVKFLGDCPWEEDLENARAACRYLGVDLEVVSMQVEYFDRVVSYALSELEAGRTPSPDIFCNQRIKFGLFDSVVGSSFDRIASGHYVVRRRRQGRTELARSPDSVKDQSYFLSHQSESQIEKSMFPIGHLQKAEVRSIARRIGLPNSGRPDSQGICFLGNINYTEFVRHYLGEREGSVVDAVTGRTLGTHSGYWFYTIGQRQGLGLSGGPWYVTDKDIVENTLFVAHKREADARMRLQFTVAEAHWIGARPCFDEAGRQSGIRLFVKLRHGPVLVGCTVIPLGHNRFEVTLDQADGGVAPGQFAVFYDGDICLGGAMIEK